MIQFLEYVETNGVLTFIIGLILLCIAFKEGYEFVMWGLGGVYNFHKDISKKEQLIETIDNLARRVESLEKRIITDNLKERIIVLESRTNDQEDQLTQIKNNLNAIISGIDELRKDNDETTVAEVRSILYAMYNDAMAKGYTTQPAMETFIHLSDIYLAKHGNSMFKNKLIPEYKQLKIIDMGGNLEELLLKEDNK